MAVITVSRQQGSGGLAIALQVSEILGYRCFDKRLMTDVMTREGFTEQTVIDYREDEYRLRGFVDRILGYRRPETIADVGFWDDNPDAMKATSVAVLDEHQAVWLVRRAIEMAYQEGNVVIVGRGGQAILHDKPGVLHVRIEAPIEARIQRLVERNQVDAKKARQYIQGRDKASAEYLERFYGVNWSDPLLYHLVINTGKWGEAAAAQCIVAALGCLEKIEAAPA